MIQEQAKQYTTDLGLTNFKGSNGWLKSFKKRHNITQLKPCGESAAINKEVVSECLLKVKFTSPCKGYTPQDTYNIEETCVL